jgi:phosphohistidine phosphatase
MKTIYVVRHAKSSWENHALRDLDRPLLEVGKKRTKKIIDFLIEKNVHPELIISSTALRCKETAKFIARGVAYPANEIQFEQSLYEAKDISLFNIFFDLSNKFNSVMIVGHNPSLTNFINQFTDEHIDYLPTSGVVCIDFDTEQWELIHSSTFHINFIVYPKLLSRANII